MAFDLVDIIFPTGAWGIIFAKVGNFTLQKTPVVKVNTVSDLEKLVKLFLLLTEDATNSLEVRLQFETFVKRLVAVVNRALGDNEDIRKKVIDGLMEEVEAIKSGDGNVI